MHRKQLAVPFALAVLATLGVSCAAHGHGHDHDRAGAGAHDAAHARLDAAFERLAALEGEWVAVESNVAPKDKVAVVYRLTGAGSAVVETLFPGAPHEMVTVYHRDGHDLVLTHYCSTGNQPRMRATALDGDVLVFEFDGGSNIDPARDEHMHTGRLEFLGADEIRADWQGWAAGKPDPSHRARLHMVRKKA